jgi:hypothetical protein
MNRYSLRFESSDNRVWEATVKADGVDENGGLIRFWYRCGPFGWFRRTAHYLAKASVICVIAEPQP